MFRGGGVQECVLALREGLVARGHEAYIITPQPHDFKGEVPEGMILVGGARPIRAAKTSSEVSASVNLSALSMMLKREDFDILHFHEPWSPMLSMQILQRSNAINIATFHAAMSERRTSRTVERVITPYTKSILKYIDVMTAVSPTATNYIRTLTNRRINMIPNGIDLKKYTPGDLEKPHQTKTIFYIGRLEKRKGVKYLLQAYAMLKQVHPEFRLILAGDGPEREKLEDLARDYRLTDVEFLGFIEESKKLQLMKEADVFCSPALFGESFGIVLLEAMACGTPVVAGNNSGYESVLRGTGQISVVNPLDSTEFARRLALLSYDKALRQVWRKWALEEVKQYDYDNIVDQYLRLYQAAYEKKVSGASVVSSK
jgi:phosphatidylinositol alpha-mannosyltransferase